jgi:hypothetical protein
VPTTRRSAATEHPTVGRSEGKLSEANFINATLPFAYSALLHFALLAVLGFLAGPAETAGNQISPTDQPRLTVRLPAVVAPVDSKKPPDPAIDAGAASGAQGVLPDSTVSNAEQSGPSLLAQSDDTYFPASEVDIRAAPDTAIDLETDEVRALPPEVIGKIVLKLWIDRSGNVEKAVPEASDMSSTITDQAVSAFSHARYRPAIRHGQAVKTVSVIEINYANDR